MSLELRRPDRTFTIRQLCLEFNVTPRALRFYEDKGLLAPERQGVKRLYGNRDRGRLQLILKGKRVGFSLAEIRELIELYDERDGGVAQMARSLKRFREKIVELNLQRVDLEGAIHILEDGCVRLETQLAMVRPDLLPQASDYESALKGRLEGVPGHAAE